jgi:phosphoenolpyruvate carboxykinase (ATP)
LEKSKNIFFLADSFGILPPISKLTPGQAAYHISGYTAKVAGRQGLQSHNLISLLVLAPFMPSSTKYAEMLSKKIQETDVKVWLINTGGQVELTEPVAE